MRARGFVMLFGVLATQSAGAQVRAPTDGGFTHSLGQPGPWRSSAGVAVGVAKGDGETHATTEARIGTYRDMMNPVVGGVGFHVETYLGTRDTRLEGGVRAGIRSPFFRLGFGADYNVASGRVGSIISYYQPVRRGGLFHDGSVLRVDFRPQRHPAASIGIASPVFHRIPPGRTRPRSDQVQLSRFRPAPDPQPKPERVRVLHDALGPARDAAARIRVLNIPFLDHVAASRQKDEAQAIADIRRLQRQLDDTAADGEIQHHRLDTEVVAFHSAVDRAFSIAVSGTADTTAPSGTSIADRAREVLLGEVLLPYDRLIGQSKRDDTTQEFANRARGVFLRWLHVESRVPVEARDAVLWVFTALLDIVEANRAAMHREWGDSRFVWLPLQYALRAEQHDTQDELDALIEQAVRDRFTDGNQVSYVINEQFQYQLSRTIRAAESYHVLWVHDFRGLDARGDPDEMSYRHVLRSYLAALTVHVRDYDRTGTFPVYMILLDEWFYQVNHGRIWMNLLENPTRYRIHLPARLSAWEDTLAAAQDSLRAAIAHSRLLQSQRRQFGDRWLLDLVKVHVNITNTADMSFWSWTLVPLVPVPDNMLRDHRKVAFYDVTEDDPYRGEALYTGAGVGEHYANLAWEDRALLVRGPAALGLKTAARAALMNQGIRLSRIPYPLQPRPRAADYEERIRAGIARAERPVRAIGLQNETGYDDKSINVAKGILYTLMPPGSVVKIPDSLWNSAFWGSALVGCALRGVRVLVIAPSLPNAPARAFGSIARSRELLWRLVAASRMLDADIQRAGGLLKVGVYSSELAVTDIPSKVRSVRRTLEQHQWLRDLFSFPESVYPGLADLADALQGVRMVDSSRAEFEYERRPKLHLKANYFASREAWSVMARPEWVDMTREFVQQRITQVQSRSSAVDSFDDVPVAFRDVGAGMLRDWYLRLRPVERERVVFYTILGSQNQNARSMVMDGEDAFIVSNWPAVIPYLDLIALVGQSRWLDDPAELEALIPRQSAMREWLAHWFRLAF